MRLINADELKEAFIEAGQNSVCELGKNWKLTWKQIRDVIDHASTVDDVKVVRGKWLKRINENYSPFDPCSSEELHICNQCGYEQEFGTNYCPDCGAKMDGERR